MARKYTDQERIDRHDFRIEFRKEAHRLSKRKDVKEFVEVYCKRVSVPETSPIGPDMYYKIVGRQQNRRRVIIEKILLDNIKPKYKNERNPHVWPDLDEKIDLLVGLVFRAIIPASEKPWVTGNQGQGQGNGP